MHVYDFTIFVAFSILFVYFYTDFCLYGSKLDPSSTFSQIYVYMVYKVFRFQMYADRYSIFYFYFSLCIESHE